MYLQRVAQTESGASLDMNALHMCLACCQMSKGVRRPEVKQHTFPYCNTCRSFGARTRTLATASLLPPTSATHAETPTALAADPAIDQFRPVSWPSLTILHWHGRFNWI